MSLYKKVMGKDPNPVLLNRVPFTNEEVDYIRRMSHIRVMKLADAIRRDRKDGVKPGNILVRRGDDPRLDRLLFDTVEASDYYDRDEFDTAEVDIDEKWYYYRFRCVGYDDVDHKLMEPDMVKVCLNEENYAYLLMQCVCHPGYTFNQLMQHNPQLAAEISNQIIIWWGEGEDVVIWPYILIPEEALEDAAVIRLSADQITGYRVVFSDEQKRGAANKGYALNLSNLRWHPLPGSESETDNGDSSSGNGSGNGGTTPTPTGDGDEG